MWTILNHTLPKHRIADFLGYLPDIVLAIDPRPIKEQVEERYAHGGGYFPYGKGNWTFNPERKTIKYPGDPTFMPIAELKVRDELFIVYENAICCVLQKDGTFDIIRMD